VLVLEARKFSMEQVKLDLPNGAEKDGVSSTCISTPYLSKPQGQIPDQLDPFPDLHFRLFLFVLLHFHIKLTLKVHFDLLYV
jgi:hypothetical protein